MRRGPPDFDLEHVPSGARGVYIILCVILPRLSVGVFDKGPVFNRFSIRELGQTWFIVLIN
jgi:hypothetical protein